MLKTDLGYLIPVLLTLPLSFIITSITILISTKLHFVNYPNPIVESHITPKAYGGGAAIALTIFIFILYFTPSEVSFILVVLPVILAGLLDDIYKLSPVNKLIFEICSVIPFLIFYINSPIYMLPVFLLVFLTFQNAWNLIDIMDGLTSGISVIIFLTAGILLSTIDELNFYSVLSLAAACSVLGFRFLNQWPAKIFLGETGSLLLGTLFAYIIIETSLIDQKAACFLLLLGSIPFFELVFLIIIRTGKGIPFYRGSPDHFALRMENAGISIKTINRRVMMICAVHSLLIISSYFAPVNYLLLLLCAFTTLIAGISAYLYFQSLPSRDTAGLKH